MTDAPGRIWAASGAYPTFDVDDWENASASAFTEFGTEYIRADIARPMTVAEAAKVLLGDDYRSPMLIKLDGFCNDADVAEDVRACLRALSQGGE